MSVASLHLATVAIAVSLSACNFCRRWILPARQTGVPPAEARGSAHPVPSHPLTWEEFVEAQRSRGLPLAVLERRFRVADANRDSILTPDEIQRHRAIAARNKNQGG